MSRRQTKSASDGRHFLIFDRETRQATVTAHGSGHDVFDWPGESEPTGKQMSAWLKAQAWTCCSWLPSDQQDESPALKRWLKQRPCRPI